MLKMFKYISLGDWLQVLTLFALICGNIWLALEIPVYIRKITDLITDEKIMAQVGSENLVGEILKNGGIMLLYAFGSIVLISGSSFLSTRFGATLTMKIRKQVFYKIESFSLEEINAFSVPYLITLTSSDPAWVSSPIQFGLRFIVQSPLMVTFAIIKIYNKSGELTLLVAVAVVFLVIVITLITVFAVPKYSKIQKLTDKINLTARENLTGLRVVRAYNAESYQEQKFDTVNKKISKTRLFVDRISGILDPAVNLASNGLSLAIVWVGAYLISPDVNLGVLIEFTSYAGIIINAFLLMVMTITMIPPGMVSAKRINSVLNMPCKINDGQGASDTGAKGVIEFKNVSFKYPGAEDSILHNVSFKVYAGETMAFVGSTGSGKSTVIKLIPRFYDAAEGQVLVDGADVKQYKLKELRDKIGYVPQKGVLFSGSVKYNITYGSADIAVKPDDESKNEEVAAVVRAAKIAHAHEFIENREDKYDSPVAQGGKNVSGGQKQRLSIARAVYKDPEIYIFDDSFSALDYKTDRDVRQALKENIKGATCLIVAQRIGTILNADRIAVLNEGRIADIGTHKELLNRCKIYQEIAYSQLSKEELSGKEASGERE